MPLGMLGLLLMQGMLLELLWELGLLIQILVQLLIGIMLIGRVQLVLFLKLLMAMILGMMLGIMMLMGIPCSNDAGNAGCIAALGGTAENNAGNSFPACPGNPCAPGNNDNATAAFFTADGNAFHCPFNL